MMVTCHDRRTALLGEGPLWHPGREQLFWFDILGKRLMTQEHGQPREWRFDEQVSAAGWIDRNSLLIASETRLFRFDMEAAEQETVAWLEADRPETRSNDGRTDPQGGFWIGTMGKDAAAGAGAIRRWYQGTLEVLYPGITIPNSICFAPGGRMAYWADTPRQQIMAQPLDGSGWPKGAPDVFADLRDQGLRPDGSVVDAEGCLWNAQWGAGRVARYDADGRFLSAIGVPPRHSSCPAFGGAGLTRLFVTSARQGLEAPGDRDGQVFVAETDVTGQAEFRVALS